MRKISVWAEDQALRHGKVPHTLPARDSTATCHSSKMEMCKADSWCWQKIPACSICDARR